MRRLANSELQKIALKMSKNENSNKFRAPDRLRAGHSANENWHSTKKEGNKMTDSDEIMN
jgi:hypothetical protein